MSAFADLKKRSLEARKNRNKVIATAAITLMGELETDAKRSGSEVTDEQVYARAKKMIASNYETIQLSKDLDKIGILNEENEFFDSLLPKQLNEDELTSLIKAMNPNNMGEVMKHLKQEYPGRFDGKVASKIAKDIIG
jgi:uncharacterized protein YqeY